MAEIIDYFKNTKISGTQKLRDFCGNGIGYELYNIINHWNNEPNGAIKYIKSKADNILSVEKLSEIFNTSKYQIYKTKKYLHSIGLLKTEYRGIPCHCNYKIDIEVENEMLDLEPDYKAKEKNLLLQKEKALNIPSDMEFVDFYEMSGGIEKEGWNLYEQLRKKGFIDAKGRQIINWKNYIIGALKMKEEQKRNQKELSAIQNYKDMGVEGLDNLIDKYKNNDCSYKPPAPKTYFSNR